MMLHDIVCTAQHEWCLMRHRVNEGLWLRMITNAVLVIWCQMRNFSKWTLMYFKCTPVKDTPWKCSKKTTLWNTSNMCLYDTGLLWCYMTLLCDIDWMIYEGYMMQAVNDVVWCEHLVWIHMQHACMLCVCARMILLWFFCLYDARAVWDERAYMSAVWSRMT